MRATASPCVSTPPRLRASACPPPHDGCPAGNDAIVPAINSPFPKFPGPCLTGPPLAPRASHRTRDLGGPLSTARPGPLAAVFDLDGVITHTAHVHSAAWKELFDDYLRDRERRHGEPFAPFTDEDYRTWVDGRPRLDGVRAFLASRGIELPEGSPDDEPGAETVAGLGARKNALFHKRLDALGVDVDHDAVRLVRELRTRGVRVGMATSSRNGDRILERAGLTDLFEARVDGVVSARLGLAGKPAPDIFLECLKRLDAPAPSLAVVVEDAPAGVRAGHAGGFGLVLGVARADNADELLEQGADRVVTSFEGVDADRLVAWFREKTKA